MAGLNDEALDGSNGAARDTLGRVELREIVERYAEAIPRVDNGLTTSGVNPRTQMPYRVGFKTLNEAPAVEAIDREWEAQRPGERSQRSTNVPYPTLSRIHIDHVITTAGSSASVPEWGIEVKRLQHVGDNGRVNDYTTSKILSPYLKDRGLIHDALRLREHGFTRRVAVLGYSFDYDEASLQAARKAHSSPDAAEVINEVGKVVHRNGGTLHTRPLIEFVDAIMSLRGLIVGPRAEARFEAWRHPAGGRGLVFGWEIRRPQLEPDYDPRHPW